MTTVLEVTLRLEKVLRYIAANPGTRISETAKKYKVAAPEIWDWLKLHNQSRPFISDALVTRVIDNAKRKQLELADVALLKPAEPHPRIRPRLGPRPQPVIKSAELPTKE